MTVQHKEDATSGMFYMEDEGTKVGEMTYTLDAGTMVIDHTYVEEESRGENIGLKLVNAAVDFARIEKIKIKPVCTYAKKVLEHGEDYKDVLVTV